MSKPTKIRDGTAVRVDAYGNEHVHLIIRGAAFSNFLFLTRAEARRLALGILRNLKTVAAINAERDNLKRSRMVAKHRDFEMGVRP